MITDRPIEDWPFVRTDEWSAGMREHVRRLVWGGCGDTHADCPCAAEALDRLAFL